MIDSKYSQCMQRGYLIKGDSCQFPDGTKCELQEFNLGECGQEWMTEEYCIEEGGYVWDKSKCCEGLVAYLPEGMEGMATCQLIAAPANKMVNNPMYWAFGLVAIALLIFVGKKLRGSR